MKAILQLLVLMTIAVFQLNSLPQTPSHEAGIATSERPTPSNSQGSESASSDETAKMPQLESVIFEFIKVIGPILGLVGVLVVAIISLSKARMDARYNYASEILKLRLRQIEQFYSPALLLVEQSRIVYEKLLWTIERKKPQLNLDGFRLLDHIYDFKDDPNLSPLISKILKIGIRLSKLIQEKAALVEGELSTIFVEYLAHFDILNAASEQQLPEDQKEGWQEFGYYPRLLNREIREGYKVLITHLKNYSEASDEIIGRLLKQEYPHLGEYRRRMMNNLLYYEHHAKEYISRSDDLDIAELRNHFIETVEATQAERPEISKDQMPCILDVGCGSGRDTIEFINRGYAVTATDASPAMCRECKKKLRNARRKGHPSAAKSLCFESAFDEIDFQSQFDGAWAAASLLHVSLDDMNNVLYRVVRTLKPGGILYMSLKYGQGEREYDTRFYSYFSRRSVTSVVAKLRVARILEIWFSNASGNNLTPIKQFCCRIKERFGLYDRDLWLNVILKKYTHARATK